MCDFYAHLEEFLENFSRDMLSRRSGNLKHEFLVIVSKEEITWWIWALMT